MKLKNIGMVTISNNRSKFYIQRLLFLGLEPQFVLILHDSFGKILPGQTKIDTTPMDEENFGKMDKKKELKEFIFKPNEPFLHTIKKAKIEHHICSTAKINSPEVINKLKERPEKIFIYSGVGGVILRKEILSIGKKFLHIHSGKLPEYRGSTTVYYSILNENKCTASALFLQPKIDAGPIIAMREFEMPGKEIDIDYIYDPYIRSELLGDVMNDYVKAGKFSIHRQIKQSGETYYIIHPVLKHIAILKCKK